MINPKKFIWGLRALIYSFVFNKIGNLTYIGKPCYIEGCKNITIGGRTRIFPGIRMEAIDKGKILIGDNCAIEQNVHIISKGSNLLIESDTTISANVFISNVDHDYCDVSISVMQQDFLEKKTQIGVGCFIGYGAVILPGTILGKHCVVGSNAVVRGIFPDYCVIAGVPAKVVKFFDLESKKWEKKS